MSWKNVGITALVLAVTALLFMAWQQHLRVQEAREEASRISLLLAQAAEREIAAVAAAARAEEEAAARVEEEARLRREAERELQRIRDRADSLAGTIGDLLPPEVVDEEVRVAVLAAVDEIRGDYEAQLTRVDSIIEQVQFVNQGLQDVIARKDVVIAEVREQLRLAIERGDAWEKAASPDLFGRVKGNAGLLAGAVGVGIIFTEGIRLLLGEG